MFDEDPWKTINLDEVKIVDSAPNVAGVDDAVDTGDWFSGLFPNKAPNPGADQQMMSGMLTILAIAAQVGTNIWTTYKQHEYQLEYMDKSHKQALERWAKENEYNSPAAVKQRLIDAGLNPNLLYGQTGAGMAGSVGNPSTPEAYVTNPSNGVASIIQAMQSQALNESQIKVNESIANKNNAEANAAGESIKIEWERLNQSERRLVADISRIYSLNEKDQSEMVNFLANAQNSLAQIGLYDAQAYNQYMQGNLHYVQSKTWEDQARAQIARDFSQAGLNNQLANESAARVTDIVKRYAMDYRESCHRIHEMDKRAQLAQGQYEAMLRDIAESKMWAEDIEKYPVSNGIRMVLDDASRLFGQAIGVSIGFGSYHHTGFNQTQQVPVSQSPHNPIGFR